MIATDVASIACGSPTWPCVLGERLGPAAPPSLHLLGPASLLSRHRTALFCSARTPGAAILRAHDAARRLRDEGAVVIGGFHSPIEKECLKILLRGTHPDGGVIICPARAIEQMRIPADCREAFVAGRILFLSPFTGKPKRVTEASALRRNEIVAALADEAYIAHIEPGSKTEQIAEKLLEWNVPLITG